MRASAILREEQAVRLRQAREAAGFARASDALARHRDWKSSTYMAHENGQNGIGPGPATEYATAYGVDPGWIMTGMGQGPKLKVEPKPAALPSNATVIGNADLGVEGLAFSRMPRDVPVLGMASCGPDGAISLPGGAVDHMRRPPRLAGVRDAYVVVSDGDSMREWRRHGEPSYAHPHQPVQIGDRVVVQVLLPDGEKVAYVKELVRRTAKELRLRQYNPPEEITIPMKSVVAVHRIMEWPELLGL